MTTDDHAETEGFEMVAAAARGDSGTKLGLAPSSTLLLTRQRDKALSVWGFEAMLKQRKRSFTIQVSQGAF